MDDNSFGARLAAARRAAGYNQTEVAKYITEAGFPVRTQAVYRLAVSAGTGELLDGTDYDTVEVGDEVSPNADFGVRIAGDSMEPRFVHGQIVWVHRQETLRSGEIGVFLYNGAGYCKRFERAAGRVELVSLNPRYAPIRVAEGDELRVFGRVVG